MRIVLATYVVLIVSQVIVGVFGHGNCCTVHPVAINAPDAWLTRQEDESDMLRRELSDQMKDSQLPGVAVTIVKDGKIKFQDAFGKADIARGVDYTNATIQPIGSISKTFIGVAIMKAIELEYFQLDTPINDILPFNVTNPNSPNTPITIKHLVTHTSGIIDRDEFYYSCYRMSPESEEKSVAVKTLTDEGVQFGERKPLGETLESYLSEGGANYQGGNFLEIKAGEKYEYSNLASSLAAFLIEVKSKITYSEFVTKHIFQPIGMNETSFVLNTEKVDNAARLYFAKDQPFPSYVNDSYPDGAVQTSNRDMGKYIREIISSYHGESKILKPSSVKQLFSPLIANDTPGLEGNGQAVFWVVDGPQVGHDGADPGTMTMLKIHLEKRTGFFVMTNICPQITSDPEGAMNSFRTAVRAAVMFLRSD